MTTADPVPEAPADAVPALLADPPWARASRREPVVLGGLEAPGTPTVESWPFGLRESWSMIPEVALHDLAPVPPEDTDWAELAALFRSGAAVSDGFRRQFYWLVMRGPRDLARELLQDERCFDVWEAADADAVLMRFAARHGLAAHPVALHAARRRGLVTALAPFRDAATARFMLDALDEPGRADDARSWFRWHGRHAAALVVPAALGEPGPARARAERALALIAREHGVERVVEAARAHGEDAAAGVSALRLDPVERYPDPLPEVDEEFVRDRLPRVLLRDRGHALPVPAVRNLVTMLRISTIDDPYGGCDQVVEHLDAASLAELAWALFENQDGRDGTWAAPHVRYALQRLGDAGTAARLARAMGGWNAPFVRSRDGHTAVAVLAEIEPDEAARRLDRLTRTADAEEMRGHARARLDMLAMLRGLTPERLADRLVPDLGPDAPEDEVRAVIADQAGRLERAMLDGRSWTAAEFCEVFGGHPLMGGLARRLVWCAGPDAFRVTADGTFADVRGDAFVLPADARVTLPHPVRLDDAGAWDGVLADVGIAQPFEQLARPAHVLTADERRAMSLHRFQGATVPTERIVGLTSRGWSLPEPPHRLVHKRQMHFTMRDGHRLMVTFGPGIHVRHPDRYADQEIGALRLIGRRQARWGDVDPVAVSELLAALLELTGAPPTTKKET
ncbi:DUF4132 domain-containing protein [Actinomadura sp. WMMB 499]|uniref:DUF4132 domain-containing protein n=1 Tax=Actinomadura sp. WMMB 499 TaxID=1219491 RepID=UPI0012466DD4|nr:DUF4132 domain-containing protein [Actinomadura sp. WMMB 499]QFG23948.1 DUF4132 domain-containing protein [Actinomadura sp. WMMB 499]